MQKRRSFLISIMAGAALCAFLGTSQVLAAGNLTATASAAERAGAAKFWTAERLISARPLTPSGAGAAGAPLEAASGPSQGGAGAPPTAQMAGRGEVLIPGGGPEAAEASTRQTSPFGARFTTSRVFPDAATTTYPYSTVGKLFFHDPRTNGNFVCSAAVQRPRIVTTAGHCVFHAAAAAANRYFYNNFLFIPAFNNGFAPFTSWDWNWAIVTGAWASGGGGVPNAQDVAILEMRDHFPILTSAPRANCFVGSCIRIGIVTGWLGYQTGSLIPNHLTILGYPCNIDSCRRMQQTNAQSFRTDSPNNVLYGSAQKGGTSGGPWVQDFGVRGVGQPAVAFGGNLIKSVSSYTYNPATNLVLGGSILDSRFISILTAACAHRAGNC